MSPLAPKKRRADANGNRGCPQSHTCEESESTRRLTASVCNAKYACVYVPTVLRDQGVEMTSDPSRIAWVSPCVAIGPFATLERGRRLVELGVTHLLNLSGSASVWEPTPVRFRVVQWGPPSDPYQLTEAEMVCAVDYM